MDDSTRTEQQVIAKQAAISYLDRRVSELRERTKQLESQRHADAKNLREQKVAAWWHDHPDITTDHLERRKTILFWLALALYVLILLRVTPLTKFVTTRYTGTDFGSAQEMAIFLGTAAVGMALLFIVFLLYYAAIFLLPFVEIPKWRLHGRQRELNEQRMTATRQVEQEVAHEMEAKYSPALAAVDQEMVETEAHIEKLKHDLDRLTMAM